MLQDIRVLQRDYLIEMAKLLTQELDLNSLLWQIVRIGINLIGGESGFSALYSEENGWQIGASYEISESTVAYIETYLSHLNDPGEDEKAEALLQINLLIKRLRSIPELNIADGVGLPLISHERVIGIVVVLRSYKRKFTINDRTLLRAFADQASIAVNNAYLYNENLKEKNRLNAIIDSAADGIIVMNSAHRIERINPAMATILHIQPDSPVGHHHDEIIVFKTVSSGMELSDGEAGGWPFSRDSKLFTEGDLEIPSMPGKTIPVSIIYTPVMTQNGIIVNIIALVQDISKFREADDLKNTFISTISHELKTPVAIIKGYASTLRMDDADWDQSVIADSLAVIEEEADRLTEMINDLLDASRINSGTMKLNKTDVSLADLSESVAKKMQKQTDKHTILASFEKDFPIIYVDADRIEQVLNNLVSNAIKYSKSGEILISGKREGACVEVSVRDEGPGLSAEDISHVFDRFYRSRLSSNQVKGTGLGLFLCQAIIVAHGGKIRAENRLDHNGAIFTFTLPVDADFHPASVNLSSHD